MASKQEYQAGEEVLSDEEKALVAKMNAELDKVAAEEKNIVVVTLSKSGTSPVSLKESYIFSGHWQDSGPPTNIPPGSPYFIHKRTPPQGSKVGLVYFGGGQRWVLAWHMPIQEPIEGKVFPGDQDKLYFEHGPDSDSPINWEEIEQKLDASTPPENYIIITPHFYIRMWQGAGRLIVTFREP